MTEIAQLIVPIAGILLPVLMLLVFFHYSNSSNKDKYNAIIAVSKNIKDAEQVKELVESLVETKKTKTSTDLRRIGLVSIFAGIGLCALDIFGLNTDIVLGLGLLVMFIGIGQMFSGYVYPNQPSEINTAVEDYEKK